MKIKLNDKQWAALVRGVLAVGVAVLTSVVAGLTGSVAAPLVVLSAVLQGMVALRAFLDTSAGRARGSEADPEDTPSTDIPSTTPTGPAPSWQK